MLNKVQSFLVVAALGFTAQAAAQTWQPVGSQPVPTGAVVFFVTQTCPKEWVEANGAPINQAANPKLYAAVGPYAPDLRGEFIRGWDRGRGVDPGRALGSYQGDEVRSHTHTVPGVAMAAPGAMPVLSTAAQPATQASGSSGGHETRPRNMALLACIKT